ncbi:Cytochrome b6-f complex iron-sulfur subunit [compost metagenome]
MSEPTPGVSQQPGPSGHVPESPPLERWRLTFPFHWDADELVSRRELLYFTVYASVTMFSTTFLLAILGALRKAEAGPVVAIARMSEIPEGGAHYFDYPGPEDQAVLLHLPGGRFVAYSLRCTHLSCAVYFQPDRQSLICPCHHGVFEPETGDPIAGPPRRRLEQIALRQEGDVLYAVAISP